MVATDIPLLYHGTTVGWLMMPDPSKKSPPPGRTYGFSFGLNQYGETSDAHQFIWLTESYNKAVDQTKIADEMVKRRIKDGKDPFLNSPMPPGRFVYEVKVSHSDIVILDLTTKILDQGMLDRVRRGVKDAVEGDNISISLHHRAKLLKMGATREDRLSYHLSRRPESGWLAWLEFELALDAQSRKTYGDRERWRRQTIFCNKAGIDFLISPQAHIHDNGDLWGDEPRGSRDWMMFTRKKPGINQSGTLGTCRTYRITERKVLPPIP